MRRSEAVAGTPSPRHRVIGHGRAARIVDNPGREVSRTGP